MSRLKGLMGSVGAALVALALVAGCGSGGSNQPAQSGGGQAASTEPIKVGVIGPMAGASADLGLAFFQGISMAADEINEQGGVNGRKIQLIQVDDQADPARAVTVTNKLIFEDKIVALLGPTNSGNAQAIKQIVNDNKVLMFTNGIVANIVDPKTLPYVWRVTAQDTSQTEYVVKYAKETGKYAILHDTSGFGEGASANFVKMLKDKGMADPVTVESYQANALDLQAQLLRIKNTGAKMIVWYGSGSDGATVGKTMQRLGISIPFTGNNGMFPSSLRIAGAALDGYTYADTVDYTNPVYQKLSDKYMKKFNSDRNFSQHEVTEGYDGMYLLFETLKKSGGKGGEELLKAVESGISFQGATGKAGKGASLNAQKRSSLDDSDMTLHVIKGGNYEQ